MSKQSVIRNPSRTIRPSHGREPAETASGSNDPPSAIIRVLLIEDNPGDARLIQEALSQAKGTPLHLERADRLAAGFTRLAEGGFDVVLLDLSLPDSQGLETFARARAAAPHLPIIVLSGLSDEEVAIKTVQAGAQDYLIKGEMSSHLLVCAIRYAIERQRIEEARARDRDLLRTLIDNLPDLIYVKDNQCRYVLDNKAHQDFVGAKATDKVIGKTVFDFYPKQLAEQFYADEIKVIRSGEPFIDREEATVNRAGHARWVSSTKVPLRDACGRVVGLVGLSRDITARKQAEEQLAHYAFELSQRNREMETDISLAGEIQQALLPQQCLGFPPEAGPREAALRFFHRYLPTTALGGDFFDVLPLSDTQVGLFICDVMGHGVRAGLVTAMVRALVGKPARVTGDAGQFLVEVNRGLLEILRKADVPAFASAFFLVADIARGEVRYANAGHPSPLLLRRDGGRVEPLRCEEGKRGPALGLHPGALYPTHRCALRERDVLVLFTDGLFEVEGAHKEYFGQERLLAATRARISVPPLKLFEELLEEAKRFSINKEFADDVCLVAMEVERLGQSSPGQG